MENNSNTVPDDSPNTIPPKPSARRQFWQGCKIGLILILLLLGACWLLLYLYNPSISDLPFIIMLFATISTSACAIAILYALIRRNFYQALGISSIILLPILYFGVCTHQILR